MNKKSHFAQGVDPFQPSSHAPDTRHAHLFAQARADAEKRAKIRQALTCDGQPIPPPPPPPVPIQNEEEWQDARDLQEMEADRARQRANALAAFEEADALETRDHEIKTRQKDIHVAPATP